LFGHRKGAFTGAEENRAGLFEVADGGTLFLDEIAELPKAMQSKLLRVLESGEVRRVGDNHPFRVDVRIVSATHRHLPSLVEKDQFRQDLMYRINTFELQVPPLRQRASDLTLLVPHLLRRYRSDARQTNEILSPEALQILQRYSWPGNIRELANVLEYASILCDRLPITPEHLPPQVSSNSSAHAAKPTTLAEIEILAIQDAIERHRGNKTAAAQELGVSIRTLYNKLGTDTGLKAA
jgi:two-component system NtrC family response regulator